MDAGQAKPTKSRTVLNAPKPSTEDSPLSWAPMVWDTETQGGAGSGPRSQKLPGLP